MAQRKTGKLDPSITRRTLRRFWDVTKTQPGITTLSVISSVGYIVLLSFVNTYVMGLIVDRVQAGHVAPDQVWQVFGPYIIALIIVNAVGQVLSKLQDYTVYKLEINGNYRLSRLCFDTLSNQSMTFHNSRFGGSLVSQTSRFTAGYTGLVDVVVYSLIPTVASIVCTIVMLAPTVPLYVAILFVALVIYVVIAYRLYKRILPLSEASSAAQNRLSGVLSDAVTNILAVKTSGREDYERDLFVAADRDARGAQTATMHAMLARGFTTSALITAIMAIASVFVAGGNAWFGISAGTLVMMFTYTYNLTMRVNYFNSMMQRINNALGDAAEMTRVLDELLLVADDPDAADLAVTRGDIDFSHIGFAYPDAPAGEYVFRDLSLHIPTGQRIGLVGKSGSGKTTLTKLLLRLDDVQDGQVLIDGGRTSPTAPSRACAGRWPMCRRSPCSSIAPCARTSPTAGPMRPRGRSCARPSRPTRWSSSSGCPRDSTPWWASAAPSSPAASASAWPSPARSSWTRPSSCSTRRPRPSTPRARRSSRARSRT